MGIKQVKWVMFSPLGKWSYEFGLQRDMEQTNFGLPRKIKF